MCSFLLNTSFSSYLHRNSIHYGVFLWDCVINIEASFITFSKENSENLIKKRKLNILLDRRCFLIFKIKYTILYSQFIHYKTLNKIFNIKNCIFIIFLFCFQIFSLYFHYWIADFFLLFHTILKWVICLYLLQ